MPRPNLSALVSKFVFREYLTPEDKTAIRGDLSAETAGAAALAQSLAATDATTKANAAAAAATAAANAAVAVETAARIANDATKQPLNSNLTAYANALNPAARRALIGAGEMPAALTSALDNPNTAFSLSNVTMYFGGEILPLPPQNTGVMYLASVNPDGSRIYTSSGYIKPTGYRFDQGYDGAISTLYNLTTGAVADFDVSDLESTIWPVGVTATFYEAPISNHLGQLCKTPTSWWKFDGEYWVEDSTVLALNASLNLKANIAAQIHTGAHSFSSTTRPISSGTGTPVINSLITRGDGDTRYKPLYVRSTALVKASVSNPTDFVPVISLALPIGAYSIEVMAYSIHKAENGCAFEVKFDTNVVVSGLEEYGTAGATSSAQQIIAPAFGERERSSPANVVTFWRRVTMLVNLTTANFIRLNYAQRLNGSTPEADHGCVFPAHIIATKL
jgi:hypothetical protein